MMLGEHTHPQAHIFSPFSQDDMDFHYPPSIPLESSAVVPDGFGTDRFALAEIEEFRIVLDKLGDQALRDLEALYELGEVRLLNQGVLPLFVGGERVD